jgi:hypothetical protein
MDGGPRCVLIRDPGRFGLPISGSPPKIALCLFCMSQIRSRRGEVDLGKPRWLPKTSAVNVQGLASFDSGCLARRLGVLGASDISRVKNALRDLLNL